MEELIPDDLASWSVLGDLLQTRSDPRGELISMMLQREQQPTPRLWEAQRRYLAKHPLAGAGVVLRRGFIAELRIESPDELAILAEPANRFVDAITLVIDGNWDEWSTALVQQRWSWGQLVLDITSPSRIELRALFACCPAIETARIQLPDDEAELVWDGVQATALRRLVLVNAGRVEELDADLPALRELWIIGEVGEAVLTRWAALERLVIANAAEDQPKNVVAYVARDEYDYQPNAFLIIGQPVEPTLIQKVIARMTVARLSVKIAELRWLRRPVTVIQLLGDQDPDLLLPYSLAIAFENVLAQPPIVLVEVDNSSGQFLSLGTHQVRGRVDEHGTTNLVRRAFDVTFGCDPGSTILDDINDALAAATEHVLVGRAGGRILNIIDPQATPLDDPDAATDEDEDEDEEEQDYDEYSEDLETQLEEPIPLARAIVKTDVHVEIESELEDEEVVDEEVTYATDEVLDRPDMWFEFRDNWDDRASDPDDESGDVRWPDPALVETEQYALERQVAQPACAEHGPFDSCNWCGLSVCWSCADTRLAGVCASCIAKTEQPLQLETTSHPRGRVVS